MITPVIGTMIAPRTRWAVAAVAALVTATAALRAGDEAAPITPAVTNDGYRFEIHQLSSTIVTTFEPDGTAAAGRASLTIEARLLPPDPRAPMWVGVRVLEEVVDWDGRTLLDGPRPLTKSFGARFEAPPARPLPSISSSWTIEGLSRIPAGLRRVRGRVTVLVPDTIETIELPFTASEDAVEPVAGFRCRIASAQPTTRGPIAELLCAQAREKDDVASGHWFPRLLDAVLVDDDRQELPGPRLMLHDARAKGEVVKSIWRVDTSRSPVGTQASALRVRLVTGVREIELPFDFRDVALAPDPDALPPVDPPAIVRRLHFGQEEIRGRLTELSSTQEVEFAAGPRRDRTTRQGTITASIQLELPDGAGRLSRTEVVLRGAATGAPLELRPMQHGDAFPRWRTVGGTFALVAMATHDGGPPARIDRLEGVVRLRRAKVRRVDVPLDAAAATPAPGNLIRIVQVDDARTVIDVTTASTVRAPFEPAPLPILTSTKILDAAREPMARNANDLGSCRFGDRLIRRFEIARDAVPPPAFARFEFVAEPEDIEVPFTFSDLPLTRRDP